jgi:hypothetical protein
MREVGSGEVRLNCMLIETADDGPRNAAGFARAPSNASASVLTSFHEGYL